MITKKDVPLRAVSKWYWMIFILCSLLASQSGCQMFGRFNQKVTAPPVIMNNPSNLDQLLRTLNAQSAKVRQVKTDVRVAMQGAPAMRGTLTVERPKRMRLKAAVAGVPALDVGSNENRFWIWQQVALPGQPPTLMYADHLAFETSPIRRQLPLDPAWLIDGLGFTEFGTSDRHRGPFTRPQDGFLEIQSFRQTANGQNIRVCVIDPKTGLIRQQSFYDQRGNLIAYLNASQHRYIAEKDVSLPSRLDLFVFDENNQSTKLSVDAGEYSINSIYGDPEHLWSMPNPPDVNKVDLSTVQPVLAPQGEAAANEASLSYQRRRPVSNTRHRLFQR
jgi:hypothetical protein